MLVVVCFVCEATGIRLEYELHHSVELSVATPVLHKFVALHTLVIEATFVDITVLVPDSVEQESNEVEQEYIVVDGLDTVTVYNKRIFV